MKRSVLSLLFLFACAPLLAQGEATLIRQVKAKLERVKDYVATGAMKVDVSFINATPSRVVMYYKAPDKFTVKKEGGISILPKGGVSVNLNALLVGDDYTIVPAGTAVVDGRQLKVVKLLPNDNSGNVVLTTFFIDEKALLIRKTNVTTKESGSYEIEMAYGKWAAWGLPDKMVFVFSTRDYKLPKGVTFEYEKGGQKPVKAKSDKGRVEITYENYTINKGVNDKVFATK
jgi:outer membrane lipoprotein-sorting protein